MQVTINQRQASLAILGLQVIAALAVLMLSLLAATPQPIIVISAGIGVVVFGGLWFAYWRNQAWAQVAAVVLNTLITAAAIILQTQVTPRPTPLIFVPAAQALLLGGPILIAIAGFGTLLIVSLGLSTLPTSPYRDPVDVLIILFVIAALILARIVLDNSISRVAHALDEAEVARKQSDIEAVNAQKQNVILKAQAEEQQRLLELISSLEVPAVRLADGVLLAPLVGNLDSRRAQRITTALLQTIVSQRTRLVILDLGGVATVDTQVAKEILDLVTAVNLLGCTATITGITAEVATTLTQLGIDLGKVLVARSPQEALQGIDRLN